MSKMVLEGVVTSDVRDKTMTVLVQRVTLDRRLCRVRSSSKKYSADDPKNECKVGDKVRIVQCKPLSKTKHFALQEILR